MERAYSLRALLGICAVSSNPSRMCERRQRGQRGRSVARRHATGTHIAPESADGLTAFRCGSAAVSSGSSGHTRAWGVRDVSWQQFRQKAPSWHHRMFKGAC